MKQRRIKMVNICFLMTVILALFRGDVNYFVSKVIPDQTFLSILSQLLLILPALYYLIKTKTNIAEAFRIKRISLLHLLLIFFFTIAFMPVLSLVNAISMLFAENHVQGTIATITENYPLWVNLLNMAIIPALLEESVYRGLFYREYSKVHVLKGMLISAFLFGCMHMNFNQFVYAFFMGIIFCLLIEATDSILAAMFMHFMINASSLMIAEISMKASVQLSELQDIQAIQTRESLLQTIPHLLIPALAGALIAYFLFKKITHISGRKAHIRQLFTGGSRNHCSTQNNASLDTSNVQTTANENTDNLVTRPLLVGILICFTIMIMSR